MQKNFQLSVQSDLGLLSFCFTSRFDWSRKLMPFSQPIRCNTQTNHDLVARVFPRFRQIGRFYSEFLLRLNGMFLLLIGRCYNFWIWFYDTQLKSAIGISVKWFLTWNIDSTPLLILLNEVHFACLVHCFRCVSYSWWMTIFCKIINTQMS